MADKTVTYRLSADITRFQARMAQASASVKKFADDSTAATREGAKFRAGMETFGRNAGRIGLVAAAGLGAAVVAAANFDQAMSHVEAATHETAANMELLRKAAIDAGQRTVFSASEAAGAIEELAKAGVSTSDILTGGLAGALDLAAAGSISVQEAAETASRAMTQFGLSGEDVPHVADLLAAAAGKATGEVTDFGMALNQSGLVAAQMGVDIEEATGTLAAFASAGLQGSDAGTSFKSMLLRLANPSEKAADTMERLGIAAYDAQGNFVGIEDLAGQLQTAFQGQSQAQRDAALATIFGSDAIRAANVLYSQGERGIARWTAKVDDSGYAAETAATKLDNLKGDLEQFRGSLETALIGTGEGSQGALRGLVQDLTKVVNAYNDLPSPAQGGVSAALGLTALAGGGLFALGKVTTGIANTRRAMQDLRIEAPKTAGALRGIGKGITFLAVIEGLNILDSTLDDVFNRDLNESDLGRSLEALKKGRVAGTILDVFGSDLRGFSQDLDTADSKWQRFIQGPLGDAIPGDSLLDEAEQHIQQIDEALANLVEGGKAGQAKKIFDQLVAAAKEGGNSVDDVRGALRQYELALDNASDGPDALNTLLGRIPDTLRHMIPQNALSDLEETKQKFRRVKVEVAGFKDALDLLNGFLDKRAAIRNYQGALDDFAQSVKKNGNNFDITTRKGRENQERLDAIAESIGQVASNLKGADKVHFLRQSIADIRALSQRLDVPPEKVQALIDKLRETARITATPKIKIVPVGFAAVENQLAHLARDRTAIVRVGMVHSGGGFEQNQFATGGPVHGPGSGTSDSIPAWLSNGEHVWTAREVANAGGHAAVSAMRAHFARYAQGGPVGASFSAKPLSDGDVHRIASALSAARPTSGDWHFHSEGDYDRAMRRERTRTAAGGYSY